MKPSITLRTGAKAFALLLGLQLTAVTAFSGGSARAGDDQGRYETADISGSFYLDEGETKTVKLDHWRNVQKLIIQAEGVRVDGTFEVIANGDTKGTVYVPGRDPSYIVTVAETIKSIQFRHVSGGKIYVRNVKAVQLKNVAGRWDDCDYDYRCGGDLDLDARNSASRLAKRAINIVDGLEKYTNYADYGDYLLPIKKAAARAYANAEARGELSGKVRESLFVLKCQIEAAKDYISENFERDAAFELAVELLELQERLDHVLR